MHICRRSASLVPVLFSMLLGAVSLWAQSSSIPLDSVHGPMCVIHDTATGVTLPLSPEKSTYNIIVTDGLATLHLTQMFINTIGNVSDIVYVFPLPHDGSVHGMSMLYRDSLYKATIREKAEAQQVYDSVVAAGGQAALLIQTRPNVFQQHLANIAYGDTAWITVEVTMPLKYVSGVFELSIPTMVADRYQSDGADPVPMTCARCWNPPDSLFEASIQINVIIQTGYPITGVESPTHEIDITTVDAVRPVLEQRGLLTADTEIPMPFSNAVMLKTGAAYPNKDFVLRFSRASAEADFSLASFYDPDRSKGYFALSLYPDPDLFIGTRPNMDIVLLIDRSGSQGGFPIAKEKEIAQAIYSRLLPADRLTVLAFSNDVSWAFGDQNSRPVTAENLALARSFVDGLTADGGTQLLSGVQAALSSAQTAGTQRYYIFLTDGFITNETAILDEIRNHPSQPVIFTFGAGGSLNRYFLEQCASAGNGFATEITQYEEVLPKVDAAWQRIEAPQLDNVTVSFGSAGVADLVNPFGTRLYMGSPITVYGTYSSPGMQQVTVSGIQNGVEVSFTKSIVFAPGRNLSRMLPQVWARQKIERLMYEQGVTEANKDSIIALSVEYQVLSQYTAFLAINPQPLAEADYANYSIRAVSMGMEVQPWKSVSDATAITTMRVSITKAGMQLDLPGGRHLAGFSIYDLHGRLIFSWRSANADAIQSFRWDCMLKNGHRLPSGHYVISIATDKEKISKTIFWR